MMNGREAKFNSSHRRMCYGGFSSYNSFFVVVLPSPNQAMAGKMSLVNYGGLGV